jgi:rhodanese-related sulfurtransferase
MERVSPQEAHRMLEDEGAVMIDCREAHEWDEMRVEGVKLVPLSEYEGNSSLVGREAAVIFICAHGNRSQVAAAIYEREYPGAASYNLEGGLAAWAARGFPTQIGPPPL